MRSLSLLLGLMAAGVAAVSGAEVCPSDAVALELRPLGTLSAAQMGNNNNFNNAPMADYQLAFVAIDPRAQGHADFVDIHYRVNNEDSVNLRVLTEQSLTANNQIAKEAKVDNIQMEGGDILRAYATYSINGVACDSAVHSWNAPEADQVVSSTQMMRERNINRRDNRENFHRENQRNINRRLRAQAEDEFWTQAAEEAEVNALQGACPAVALDQDILKQAGLRDTFVLSFENKTPARQLHYVDLHLTNEGADADINEWDGLRLASDMQLELAHKVMQPGVVVKPNQQLSWFWTYSVAAADGSVVECSTPIQTITPADVTHEVNI